MRRTHGALLVILCLAVGAGARAQSMFPSDSAPPQATRLEVVGVDYTHPLPMKDPPCDPYYPDPSCDPGGGSSGPNYGSGTSNFAQQHFVPHMLMGGGFGTLITITNLANAVNTGQLLYWGADGSTLSRTGFTLPPGATMRLQTPEASRSGPLTAQWLTVSSNLNIGINSFFELRDGSGKVVNTIGFNDPQEGNNFSVPVEFQPATNGAIAHTTGLAVANDTSDPTKVTLTLLDRNGKTLASFVKSLVAFEQFNLDLSSIPAFQAVLPATDFIGTLNVSSDHVVSAIALEDDFGQFYSTPSIAGATAGQLVVPHILSGGGFVTLLTLLNLDVVNNTFNVKFYDDNGKQVSEQTQSVVPGGTARISTGEGARFGPSQPASWALVTSSAGAEVNAFFELKDSGGKVINTIGFNSAPPVTDFTIPVEFMPPPPGGIGRTVGVAFVNPSSSSATITLKLVDATGAKLATSTLTLGPNAHKGIDLSTMPEFKSVLPAGDFIGVLTVTSTVPVSTIALGDDFGPFYSTPAMAGRAQ